MSFSTFSKVSAPTHSWVNQPVVMSRRTLTPPPQVRSVMTARFFFIAWKEQHGISQEAANKGLNIVLFSWRVSLPRRQDAKRGDGRCKTEVGDRLGFSDSVGGACCAGQAPPTRPCRLQSHSDNSVIDCLSFINRESH